MGLFQIAEIEPSESGASITGRCIAGSVYVGQRFTRFGKYVHGCDDLDPATVMPVALEVDRIEAYGRLFTELREGWTARLILRGESGMLKKGFELDDG